MTCAALLVPDVPGAGAIARFAPTTPRTTAGAVPADFALRFLQDARTVTAGENVTYAVRVKPAGHFTGTVVFELPNITDGLTARLIPGATAYEWTLQISVPASVSANSRVFVLRGTSGPLVRTAQFRLTVNSAPDTVALPTATAPIERPKPAYVDNPHGARQKAAAYAYTWALTTNPEFVLFAGARITVPSDNPDARGRAIDYADQFELDCTNYMSQALRASGFDFLRTWRYDATRHVATTAWVRAAGPGGMPATFVKYGRMRLVNPQGTVLGQPPPPGIQIGDIVVWDLNARRPMHIDHQLMVTEVSGAGASWGDIRVSYHTYDHRNRDMDEYQDFVAPDAPKAHLYVFHVNYPS